MLAIIRAITRVMSYLAQHEEDKAEVVAAVRACTARAKKGDSRPRA